MRNIICILAAFAFLAGCAARIQPVTAAKIEQIREGHTTRADLLAIFGAPLSRTTTSDGLEVLGWGYGESTFSGYQSRSVSVTLDRSGTVVGYTASETGNPPR